MTASAFAEVAEEDQDGDLTELFRKEGLPDDDKCMWLYSGSSSPSNSFDDYKSSSLLNFSPDKWLVSLLSISANSENFLGRSITFFDGSRVNPIEEASLVLEKTSSDEELSLQEYVEEEEVVTWLVTSIRNDLEDSSVARSECAESTSHQSVEDSCSCDNSSSLSSTQLEFPWIWDKDGTGFCVSLVNLDGADSKWFSYTQPELDCFQSDFPSPSFKSSWGSEVQSLNSSLSSLITTKTEESVCASSFGSDRVSEAVDFDDLSCDQPLFWPCDEKSDWGSEVKWEFFIMSPCKNNREVGTLDVTSPESMRLRVHTKKMTSERGCRRRLLFGSGSKSTKVLEFKRTGGNKEVRRIHTMPSRLNKSSKNSMIIVPLDMENDMIERTELKADKEPMDKFRNLLEEDFVSNEELPIETLLGLDEFDGHEGIEPEFNKDNFSLDESF